MFEFKAQIAVNSRAIRKICNAEVGHLALSEVGSTICPYSVLE
jgi:hypothetical protein